MRRAAVVGIGATEFSKASGRSELHLAVEAVDAALTDASRKKLVTSCVDLWIKGNLPGLTAGAAAGVFAI